MSNSDKLKRIRNAIKDEKVEFYFIPSARLKDLILQNSHPIIQKLPQDLKVVFLQSKAVAITNDMVMNFIDETIDDNNKFILDNGEIRVVDNNDLRLSASDLRAKGE
ncbi:hypothetical protein CMI47_08905 [Candidatus Pacearchaeota archaeon]|jgi:hypothetical protein|nr:hypothetical protein [Candidatus Pacearchaeota archaeon]|tara:strand:+ start:5453 stop:5773 length:321 start_codon:yes stop_codon:yes gene_type:complete